MLVEGLVRTDPTPETTDATTEPKRRRAAEIRAMLERPGAEAIRDALNSVNTAAKIREYFGDGYEVSRQVERHAMLAVMARQAR